jgi:hypothetical protein
MSLRRHRFRGLRDPEKIGDKPAPPDRPPFSHWTLKSFRSLSVITPTQPPILVPDKLLVRSGVARGDPRFVSVGGGALAATGDLGSGRVLL